MDSATRFRAIQKQKAYVGIAEQIIGSIRAGAYKIGDRLPASRELEKLFAVSRPTIREAFSALELAGVVEIRTGQGAFVAAVPASAHDGAEFKLDVGESPAEVLELRVVLEPEAARLAAERASADDLTALQGALQELGAEMNEDQPGIGGDIKFHVAVAKASGNAVVYKVMRALAHYLNQSLWGALRDQAWARTARLGTVYLEQHRRTLAAIQHRDGRTAAATMLEHLRRVQNDLFPDQ